MSDGPDVRGTPPVETGDNRTKAIDRAGSKSRNPSDCRACG